MERVVFNVLKQGTAALPPNFLAFEEVDPPLMPTDRSTLARECIDHPKPVLSLRTQTSSYGILPDVIHVRCELRATLISSQSMIEISFLPKDMIDTWMETFPISNYVAHRLITRKRQHCVQVIRH